MNGINLKNKIINISNGNDIGNIVIGYCKDTGLNILQYIEENQEPICMHRDTREEEIQELKQFIHINPSFTPIEDLIITENDFNI
jgi:hypothetical protein